jgi:hypothetical protein
MKEEVVSWLLPDVPKVVHEGEWVGARPLLRDTLS